MLNQPLVVFDFDGVIVNSYDITYATSKHFEGHRDHDEFRSIYEESIYARVVPNQERTNPNHERDWYAHITPLYYQLPPVTGVPDALHLLAERFELAIVTSNQTEVVLRWLALVGLDQRFSDVLGGDVERSKVKKITSLLQGRPAVFITDTLGDVLEAKAVPVPTIAVSWGFHEHWRLEKGTPDAIIDSPWELTQAVHGLLGEHAGHP